METWTGWRKYFVSVWCILETFLFGGLWYGWPSLVFMLKQEGIYYDLCEKDVSYQPRDSNNETHQNVTYPMTKICQAQDDKFALAVTIATVALDINTFACGHVNYKFGTRVTRVLGISMFIPGSLMLAFVSVDIPWLIFPGISLLAMGGYVLIMTNVQIADLFDKRGSTFVCVLCGAYDISSIIMTAIKIAFENGISRKYPFIVLSASHSLVIFSTFVLLPKKFITKPAQLPNQDCSPSVKVGNTNVQQDAASRELRLEEKARDLPLLKTCIVSRTYLLHVFWFSLLKLRFNHFIGSLNIFLNRLLNGDKKSVSYYTNTCYFIMLSGIVTSLLVGILHDWQKHVFIGSRSKIRRELMPAVLPLLLGSAIAMLMSVLVIIPETEVLYLTFAVMTSYRSLLFGVSAAFISAIFPIEYFGILHGILHLIAGIIAFSMYGFYIWADAYNAAPEHASMVLLCLVTITLVHPLYQWWVSRRDEKQTRERHTLSK